MNLDTPLKNISTDKARVGALLKLGIFSVRDILHFFPNRYEEPAVIRNIAEATCGERVSLAGIVSNLDYRKTFSSRVAIATAKLTDQTGSIELVWFHQPYIAKILPENSLIMVTGTISEDKKGRLFMSNAEYEKISEAPEGLSHTLFKKTDSSLPSTLFPVYRETKGLTSKWLHHTIKKILASGILHEIEDPLPEDIRERYNLPSIQTALLWIHTPKRIEETEGARKRFAFEEIFLIQLEKQRARHEYEEQNAWEIGGKNGNNREKKKEVSEFVKRFGFPLTAGQTKIIDQILDEFASNKPLSRLLEGDVGSGKTAIAAATAHAVATTYPKGQDFGSLQVGYMCPTEVLARQHFESFINYYKNDAVLSGIKIGLITGSECKKFPSKTNPHEATHISRSQLLKWVENGEISIVIGTHSLIQEKVRFKHLAYVIIDEQHRFGTAQRKKLAEKDARIPHLLSMTATPIPRTLALTIYGDLDISVLDEMPAGRKPVITKIIPSTDRSKTYEEIRIRLCEGRQLYVICPRIDEPDPAKEKALAAKSVIEEAKRLKKEIFPEFSIGLMHGKMTAKAKDSVMNEFSAGKINILVATSVIEVGVNVPNATMIIIEDAGRFGLAQLHQLRGRVVRSSMQAYCYIFSETNGKSSSEKTVERLGALLKAKNGFELAEYDLGYRGAGSLYGGKQWGISDLAMEALKNTKMVEAARDEAAKMIDNDPLLSTKPLLRKFIENGERGIHFE